MSTLCSETDWALTGYVTQRHSSPLASHSRPVEDASGGDPKMGELIKYELGQWERLKSLALNL